MTRRYWLTGAALLLLICLLWQMPARWVLAQLGQDSPLRWQTLQGTLWQGRAEGVTLQFEGQPWALGQVDWQWRPLRLLQLRLCATLQARLDGQNMEGLACQHLSGDWSLHQFEVTAPAMLLELALPAPARGQLSLYIDQLQAEGNRLSELQANTSWRDASVMAVRDNARQWLALGSFVGEWQVDDAGALTGKVVDLDGPLETQLTLRWPYQQPQQWQGQIRQRQADPVLTQMLLALGFSQQNGFLKVDDNR